MYLPLYAALCIYYIANSIINDVILLLECVD